MPRKSRSAKAIPEPEKDSQEKQKSSTFVVQNLRQLIVEWFCTGHKNGVRVNYDAYTTGNHSDAVEKMLNQTGLVVKKGVIKEKATEKMVDMSKQYKDLRHTIEQSGWRTGLGGANGISHEDRELQTGSCKTAKELILNLCAWYYEYKEVCDYPRVNPPTLIKSEQPTDRDGQIVNSFELGSYSKDLQEGESPLPDPGE